MIRNLLISAFAVVILFGAANARAQSAGQTGETPLTNSSIVKLVRAGFREKTVIAILRSRPTRFDLAPDRLIELKRNGVNERIILAMIARQETSDFAAEEDWDDDGFQREGDGAFVKPQSTDPKPQSADPGEVNIFGSSGGSRSSVRSRGRGTGGGASDTETVGSATVRIIRPPAEAGGAPPKLERTPTLTNKGVVELVEAGFTEGTIIRRIEQSPVEFDLSPGELAELRKRRVSEQVIKAMRTAMGEEAGPSNSPEK